MGLLGCAWPSSHELSCGGGALAFLLLSLVTVEGTRPKRRQRRAPGTVPLPHTTPRADTEGRNPAAPLSYRWHPDRCPSRTRLFPGAGCLSRAAREHSSSERSYRGGLEVAGPESRWAGRVGDFWRAVPSGRWGESCLRTCRPLFAVGAGPRRRTRRPSRRGARTGRVRGRRGR